MMKRKCWACRSIFLVKPSTVKRGWGKFCSKRCQFEGQKKGKVVQCAICARNIYKSERDFRHSKSGKLFCSKSCSAVWRNQTVLAGERHVNWKDGESAYRQILLRHSQKPRCIRCALSDQRVLVVHHKDGNRKNNSLKNLCWLCCNCHFLLHHYPKEAQLIGR